MVLFRGGRVLLRWIFLITFLVTAPVRAADFAADFAIAITDPADGDWDGSVQIARDAGATATSLMLFWDEFDKQGIYAPDADWPEIANSYYPGQNLKLTLVIAVLDTVADRRPRDLRQLDWADPALAARFVAFMGEVLHRLKDTDLVAIAVGNEVDGVLSGQDWAGYQAFFEAVKPKINALRPNVPVGTTMMWQGLQDNAQAQALANAGDAWMVNYYPLDDRFRVLPNAAFPAQLDRMIAAASGRPVLLTETGYPSHGCGASPEGQREFVQVLLQAWQARKQQIPLVEINWLNDISPEATAGYGRYYGLGNKCFLSYLGGLGLRDLAGADKPALAWLRAR